MFLKVKEADIECNIHYYVFVDVQKTLRDRLLYL